MNKIIFQVADAPEGGYTARALDASIYTEAGTLPILRDAIRDAVRCHFGEGLVPAVIRIDHGSFVEELF